MYLNMIFRTATRTSFRLVVLLLTLAAVGCDAVDSTPSSERELVGTWDLDRIQVDTYLTTSAKQEALDPDQKGVGRIALSGDLQGELIYLGRTFLLGPGDPIFVSAEPLNELGFSETSEDAVLLRVAQRDPGDPVSVDLIVGTDVRYSASVSSSVAFDAETRTLSLDNVALLAPGGGTVTANGVLTAATQTLPEGEAVLVGGYTLSTPPSTLVFTFDEDGTFAAISADGGDGEPETTVGTWKVQDGELVLGGDDEDGQSVPPQRWAYRVDEGRLTLENMETGFTGASEGALGPRLYEQAYGLAEGSLIEIGQRSVLEFAAASR